MSNEHFKQLIEMKMDEQKLSVNKLAVRSGASRDTIYRYLNGGTKSINSSDLALVFDYLGIEVG